MTDRNMTAMDLTPAFPPADRKPAFSTSRGLAARRDSVPRSDGYVLKVLTIGMAAAVMTQKIAVPLESGKIALQVALLIQCGVIAALVYGRRIKVSLSKLLLFSIFGSLALAVHLIRGRADFSVPSLFYVLSIYGTYVFVTPINRTTFDRYLKNIIIIGLCASGLVFVDWAFQVVGRAMPNIENFIPKPLIFFNYVYIQPLEWGNHYTKPNGFFFLETSYVSQFIAFSLAIEVCLFQRFRYIGVLALGLLCSFGGTGMTLILLSTPVILFHLRLKLLPLLLLSLPVLIFTADRIGLVDNVTKRSTEFNQAGSSGNQRFTLQATRVAEVMEGPTQDALLGLGAGQMPQHLNMLWTPISKVLVEYGLFVAIAFWAFFFFSVFGRGVPFIVSWIMAMQYMFLNGSFLVPLNSFYCVMFAAFFKVVADRKPLAGSRLAP